MEERPDSSESHLALYCSKPHWGREVPVCLLFWGNLGGRPNSTMATKS
jgi:hypothetical protein